MSFLDKLHIPQGTRISITENRNLSDRFGDSKANGEIRINTAKGDVVDTVIHELLHVADFNKSEDKVAAQSRRIEKSMTLAEAGFLLLAASQSQRPLPQREITHTTAGNIISSNKHYGN